MIIYEGKPFISRVASWWCGLSFVIFTLGFVLNMFSLL